MSSEQMDPNITMLTGGAGMIIIMHKGATAREIANVTARVEQLGPLLPCA